jgi:hypothetical protein
LSPTVKLDIRAHTELVVPGDRDVLVCLLLDNPGKRGSELPAPGFRVRDDVKDVAQHEDHYRDDEADTPHPGVDPSPHSAEHIGRQQQEEHKRDQKVPFK